MWISDACFCVAGLRALRTPVYRCSFYWATFIQVMEAKQKYQALRL